MLTHCLIRGLDGMTQALLHKAGSELQIGECIHQIQERLLCHFSYLLLKSFQNALSSSRVENDINKPEVLEKPSESLRFILY